MTGRPEKGSPEWDLWVAAIEVAIAPPLSHTKTTTPTAKVRWTAITELRAALDALGVDWRTAKAKDDAARGGFATAARAAKVQARLDEDAER